jgi:predicted permease
MNAEPFSLSFSFGHALMVSFSAVANLFLVAAVGFILVRRRILSHDTVGGITRMMIDVIVPCALAVSMIKGFRLEDMTTLSPMILMLAVALPLTTVVTLAYFRLTGGGLRDDRDMAASALATIPNSFYVPIPVALAVCPPEYHVEVGVIIGVAVLAVNPLQWTLGTWLVTGNRKDRPTGLASLRALLNGPLVGILLGALLAQVPPIVAAAQGRHEETFFPLPTIVGAAELIGRAMAPMAMLITGALVAMCEFGRLITLRRLLPIVAMRFLVVPGSVFLMLRAGWFHATPLVAFLMMLEAASPPAMNLALAARRFGGDWATVSALSFWANLLSLAALPVWMALAMSLT